MMISRRVAGAGLLVVALVGLLVINGLRGVRVAGTAIAPPGRSAPAVGDCLIQLRTASLTGPAAGRPASEPVIGISEDAVSFARCGSADQLGEVVGYQQYPQQSAATDTDIGWCQQISDDYRAHQVYRFKDAAGGLWEPSTGQRYVAVLSRPNADQHEPRWVACAVLAPYVESYRGSYLRSLADAPAPPPFGLCLTGGEAPRWVSCLTGHRTQELGTGTGQPMTARAGIAACQTLIASMTGLPDITAGGRLRVEVVGGSPPPAELATGAEPGPSTRGSAGPGSCRLSVLGQQQLVGTLIGVGTGALPIE
jgi:hypothetical protein